MTAHVESSSYGATKCDSDTDDTIADESLLLPQGTQTPARYCFQCIDDQQHPSIFWDNFSTAMWLITDILWTENNPLAVCIAPFVVVGYVKAFFSFYGDWARYATDLARTVAMCSWILGNTFWLFQELSENKEKTGIDATILFPYDPWVILTLFLITMMIEPGIFFYYRSRGIDWFKLTPILKPIGNMGMMCWAMKDFAWYLAGEEMLKEEYVWIPKVVWAIADVLIMYQLFPLFFQALQAWGIFSCFTEYASYKQREKTFFERFAHVIDELATSSWALSMTLWSFGEIFMPNDTFAQNLTNAPAKGNLRWWCGHVLILGAFPFFVKVTMDVFSQINYVAKKRRRSCPENLEN